MAEIYYFLKYIKDAFSKAKTTDTWVSRFVHCVLLYGPLSSGNIICLPLPQRHLIRLFTCNFTQWWSLAILNGASTSFPYNPSFIVRHILQMFQKIPYASDKSYLPLHQINSPTLRTHHTTHTNLNQDNPKTWILILKLIGETNCTVSTIRIL